MSVDSFTRSYEQIEEKIEADEWCKSALIKHIGSIINKFWESDSIEQAYKLLYWEPYVWSNWQIIRLFSYYRIKEYLEIWIDLEWESFYQVDLANPNSYLVIRDENKNKVWRLADKTWVKYLWEWYERNWYEYVKILYRDEKFQRKEWYVAENYLSQSNFDKYWVLDKYLLSLWFSTSDEVKAMIYKRIFPTKNYFAWLNRNTQLDRNIEIFHRIIQDFDLHDFLEWVESNEIHSSVVEELDILANELTFQIQSQNKQNKLELSEPKESQNNSQKEEDDYNSDKIEQITNNILQDHKFTDYIWKIVWNTLLWCLNDFSRKIFWDNLEEWDIVWYSRLYAYLFIKVNNLTLYDYINSIKSEYPQLYQLYNSERQTLYNRYANTFKWYDFSTSQNLTIFYWLIIEKELWIWFWDIKKSTQERFDYWKMNWLDISNIVSYWYVRRNWVTYCSLTARKNLETLWVNEPTHLMRWDASVLYRRSVRTEWTVTGNNISSYIKNLAVNEWDNVFDIRIYNSSTWTYHRAVWVLWLDSEVYVLDPYTNWRPTRPFKLSERSRIRNWNNTFSIIWHNIA